MDDRSTEIAAEAEAIIAGVNLDPMLRAQMDLEDGMIEAGKARYWEMVGKATSAAERGSESTPARAAIRLGHDKLAAAVAEWVAAKRAAKRRRPAGFRTIEAVDPETVAFISLRVVFNSLATSAATVTIPKLAIRIGMALADEAMLRQYEERHPAIVHLIKQRLESASRIHYRRILKASLNRKAPDIVEQNLPDADYMLVGLPIVELVQTATGLITTGGGKFSPHVTMSEECQRFFDDVHARAQFFYPEFGPTIVPPRPWRGMRAGGYHYGLAGKLTLVKTRDKEHRRLIGETAMPLVYAGLNALQNTAWRINQQVLEIFDYALRVDSGIGGLPQVGDVVVPPCPADIPLDKNKRTEEQQERCDRWRRTAAAAYRENEERAGARKAISNTLSQANKYAEFERIYFPHTLDFRGRAYPVTSFLTPQGTDYQKALLEFSEAKPMTAESRGLFWLSVHGANCMADCPFTGEKLDKGKLNARADWVQRNSELIWQTARDPLNHMDFWTKADAPFQFLAFCFEWDRVAEALARGEVPTSRLPIALDGSCNGLQHFSAMMRDEVGGAAVNLIPQETPADIYSMVKAAATEEIVHISTQPSKPVLVEEEDEDEEAEVIDTGVEGITGKAKAKKKRKVRVDPVKMALAWLASGQLDRTMFKRPVMTTPYGSKLFGIKGQIREELRKRKYRFPDGDGFSEAAFLAGVTVEAIGSVVVKSRQVMDWLQHTAALMTKVGAAVVWVAPSGFIVRQAYPKVTGKQIETFFHGIRFRPQLDVEQENTLDRNRQTNGVAPNFVHMLDASAMILTVARLWLDHGIDAFAMIHDSYATHAADTQLLAETLRDVFVRMYLENDPLGEYEQTVRAILETTPHEDDVLADLKDAPRKGKLDLNMIRQSDFFFA